MQFNFSMEMVVEIYYGYVDRYGLIMARPKFYCKTTLQCEQMTAKVIKSM